MEVKVEIISNQIFEDGKKVSESNKTTGKIEYHENGTTLEFCEKYEEQELKFKITILENKIIICRNGQNMTLDQNNKTTASLETPYGWMKMQVTTNKVEITKEESIIKNLHFEYQIELEDSMKYDNIVDISCSAM